MVKPGKTGQTPIVRNIQNPERGDIFYKFVDFCQLWYIYFTYF